jgi:hypothetical protein
LHRPTVTISSLCLTNGTDLAAEGRHEMEGKMKTILAGFLALGMAMSSGIVAAQAATVYTPNTTTVTGDAAG